VRFAHNPELGKVEALFELLDVQMQPTGERVTVQG
jgi:hypothetical protein